MAITFLFYTAKKSEAVETGCNNVLGATLFLVVNNIYLTFHASHKARVFRECENKNMKIFASVASIWYVEDSKLDFINENTAHGNRLLLFYKSKIIEIEKDEYFSDNCKKYSHCSTNSKPNSAYCSSTNSHCE